MIKWKVYNANPFDVGDRFVLRGQVERNGEEHWLEVELNDWPGTFVQAQEFIRGKLEQVKAE